MVAQPAVRLLLLSRPSGASVRSEAVVSSPVQTGLLAEGVVRGGRGGDATSGLQAQLRALSVNSPLCPSRTWSLVPPSGGRGRRPWRTHGHNCSGGEETASARSGDARKHVGYAQPGHISLMQGLDSTIDIRKDFLWACGMSLLKLPTKRIIFKVPNDAKIKAIIWSDLV